MLLTVLLLAAAAVLLGVAGLALWEFWNEAEVEGAAHVLTATPARTPTPPTLDRQQRIASRRAPRRPPRPPTPIPPPELRRFPASYGPVDEDEDESDMETVMAFPTDYLRDEADGETVVVKAEDYLYDDAHLDE
ncbi:MAG: hypothetical protein ACI8PZ_002943 [Myxococcota bacterium]|jgi:hypothetical protein